jgi:CRISPR-associated endonuclease/helicase Cas3
MANASYSYKLNSHSNPDKLLINHLRKVSYLCSKTVNESILNLDGDIDKQIFEDISYIIGATHDLGKGTTFFQEYLVEKDEAKKRSLGAMEITHHGLLSAFFTYAIIRKYLDKKEIKGKYSSILPIVSFLIVKRHHGNLLNALDEINKIDTDGERIFKVASDQLYALDLSEIQAILDELLLEKIGIEIDINDVKREILGEIQRKISRNEKRLIRDLKRESDILIYFLMQFLYSALLDADKTDAGLGDIRVKRITLDPDIVDQYRKRKGFLEPKKSIDQLRNDIYYAVTGEAAKLDLNDRILSLNVPTGTGKTQTALSFAIKLRERLDKEKGFMPRVIYALPFLSIIDQNYGVFEEILAGDNNKIPNSSVLLKHHHLAEIKYHIDEEPDYEANKSLMLLEGWNSEVIVTTFWQVFHTIFSNRNHMLRKFNKLANAIIILDEVQSIPHQYWKLMHDALEVLCQKFNSYVILVTATQPLIFDENKQEIRELAIKKGEYFRSLNRIELTPHLNVSYTLDEFGGLIENNLNIEKNKSFLIVLNTIDSATKIHNFIKKLDLDNTELYYLSTNIIPKERLKRIEEIKKGSKGRKVIVSTQLIEAGVDLDADIVYRDFAPLDSINQVAGRCNRNNLGKDKGKVSIFILKGDKSEFYKYIYDPFLIDKTMEVLKFKERDGTISESQFLDLNNQYYRKVKRGMSDDSSEKNLTYLYRLCFKKLNEEVKLIDNDLPEIDVFIELDERAKDVWLDYQDARSEKDLNAKREKTLKIKKELYDYVISVPKRYASTLINETREISYISEIELPSYYDKETGFKRGNSGTGTLIPDLD